MKSKMKPAYMYLIIIGIILVLGCGIFLLRSNWSTNTSVSSSGPAVHQLYKRLLLIKTARELESFFRDPTSHKWWPLVAENCLSKYQLSEKESYRLNCSSEVIECLDAFKKIKNKPLISERINNEKLEVFLTSNKNEKLYEVVSPSLTNNPQIQGQAFSINLELNDKKESLKIILDNNCHEAFLDERNYAYGEKKTDKNSEIYFDTFGKKYFIDVHLATIGEYNRWVAAAKPQGLIEIKDPQLSFLPVTHLKKNQMHAYCGFWGKQIMQAHLYDAATFIPFEMREKQSRNFERGSYYWVKKNSEAWITKSELELTEKNCNLVFSEECKNKYPNLHWGSEPTWAGLRQVMGGIFEYLYNPIDSKENLRVSSFYFPLKSSWHKLGKRAFWDGEGFDSSHFNFGDGEQIPVIYKGINLAVGFRCMREVNIQ